MRAFGLNGISSEKNSEISLGITKVYKRYFQDNISKSKCNPYLLTV